MLFVNHTGEMGGAEFVLSELTAQLLFPLGVAMLSPDPLVERLTRQDIHVVVLGGDDELVSLGKEITILSRL